MMRPETRDMSPDTLLAREHFTEAVRKAPDAALSGAREQLSALRGNAVPDTIEIINAEIARRKLGE